MKMLTGMQDVKQQIWLVYLLILLTVMMYGINGFSDLNHLFSTQ